MIFVILFGLIAIGILLWCDIRKPDHFPPGPKWFPIIGSMLLVKRLRNTYHFFHLVWYHFYEIYGPIVGTRIGNTRIVIVSGRDAIREFYNNDHLNGRPRGFFYRVRTFNKTLGLVFVENEFWDIQRKFSSKILRQMGMGRSSMIDQVEQECEQMIQYFRKQSENGQVIEMRYAFDIPVINTLWSLVAGYRFQYGDQRLEKLLHMIHECFRISDMTGGILNLIPFVRFIAPVSSGYEALLNVHKPIWAFLRDTIAEIRYTKTSDSNKSFIHSYLEELSKKSNGEFVHDSFSDDQLLSVCLDFFQAGTETTSNTMIFGLMYMLHNKHVSDKVQAELDAVIGRKRLPIAKDRSHLPYVEAVLSEISRFCNVAPLAIAHRASKTSKLQQYIIPKDCLMLVSLYSLNMDKGYWKDPEIFRPERFLDSNGEYIQHGDQFMPFGSGKRRCPGEQLAKTTSFLFFASFMHSFNMIIPDGSTLPDVQPHDGITLQPKPFQLRLQSRF